MNFEKIKTLKLVIFALLCCPTVTVQSKQLLHIGTPKREVVYNTSCFFLAGPFKPEVGYLFLPLCSS